MNDQETPMPRTTPQTQLLADILVYGQDAAATFTLVRAQGWSPEQLTKAARALAQAVSWAHRASWDQAEHALDRAYTVLGSDNPGTGYEFYCGLHPIQRCAQETA